MIASVEPTAMLRRCQEFTLAGFHRLTVVVAEQVQQPVRQRPPPLGAHDLWAQDDVAERARNALGSGSRPSIGKESTSVGSSIPRWSRLRALISSLPTNASPSSPSSIPSACSTARASSTAAFSSTSTPLLFATSTETTS